MFVRNRRGLALPVLATALLALPALLPTRAWALGLGDIHLKSTLDAPLSADIDVVDANVDDLSTLKAALASRDTYSHFGADYPSFLGTLTFTSEHTADGRAVISCELLGCRRRALRDAAGRGRLGAWPRGARIHRAARPAGVQFQNAEHGEVAAPQVDSGTRSGTIDHPETASAAPSAPVAAAPSATDAAPAAAADSPAPVEPSSKPAVSAVPVVASAGKPTKHHHRAAAKAAGAAAAAAAGTDSAPQGAPRQRQGK